MSSVERITTRRSFNQTPDEQEHAEIGPRYVRVVERSPEVLEASVAMSLSAVRRLDHDLDHTETKRDEEPAAAAVQTLLSTLTTGQSITSVYEWRGDATGNRRFDWRVVCEGAGVARSQAIERLKELNDSFQCTMGNSAVGLAFSPMAGEKGECLADDWQYRYALDPVCLTTRGGRNAHAGFDTAADLSKPVVLRLPVYHGPIQCGSEIAFGAAINGNFNISVGIARIELSDEDIHLLEGARETLLTGPVGQLHVLGSQSGHVYDDRVLSAVLQHLERWLCNPVGYRVRCRALADVPLPPAVLQGTGGALFGGTPVEIQRITESREEAEPVEEQALNLAACFHPWEEGPGLVPARSALEEAGVSPLFPAAASAPFDHQGLTLGYSGTQGGSRPVRIADRDRMRHCYILGATGTGKSTLLHNMVLQDIREGNGLCLMDPHGDLYRGILDSIPPHRARDVVLVDLADTQYSVGLNFLECDGRQGLETSFIVNEMLTIFHRLYDLSQVGGPMFEMYMRNALFAVLDSDLGPATLLDVVRFFEDGDYRVHVKNHCTNPICVSFWTRQAEQRYGESSLSNIAPYITSKLNQFVQNALLRPVIGQRFSTIDFRKSMDEGRIVLVNLAKGLLGEYDARLLGMLLVGKILNAALGRVTMPPQDRRSFHLYVDEFQNLATSTAVALLSEARKFGLSFVMANQHLAQLSDDGARGIDEAILGNVGTMLSFRMGPGDAERLETYTRPVLHADDLQQLPDWHVACRMVSGNEPVRPFVFETLPAHSSSGVWGGDRNPLSDNIKRRTRHHHARRRDEIEREIIQDWTKTLPDG